MNAQLVVLVGAAIVVSACEQTDAPDPGAGAADAVAEGPDGVAPRVDGHIEPDGSIDDAGPGPPDGWDGSGCPDTTRPPLSECNRAMVVAQCGGGGVPRLFCRAIDDLPEPECMWFAGGCPAREFSRRCDAASLPDCYPGRFGGFGSAPWTLDRATTVDIAVDPALAVPDAVTVDCEPCGVAPGAMAPDGWEDGRCLRRTGLCGELHEPLQLVNLSAGWSWPSWVSRMFVHPSLAGGATLLVEFDPRAEPGRARVCIVWQSDAGINEVPPVCATGGELELDRWPASRGEAAMMHGRLVVEFPTLSPFPDVDPFVGGLRIEARF